MILLRVEQQSAPNLDWWNDEMRITLTAECLFGYMYFDELRRDAMYVYKQAKS